MTSQRFQYRSFIAILMVVTLLHALLLLIPAVRQSSPETAAVTSLRIKLSQPEALYGSRATEVKTKTIPTAKAGLPSPPLIRHRRRIELAELPTPDPEPATTEISKIIPNPPDISRRILSRQFDLQLDESIFGPIEQEPSDKTEYLVHIRPGLEEVLKEPSLQLPFRDTRVYLVESYAPGAAGSIGRFFDTVTVPFGWTTKSNTRIQCAWVLIVTSCGWGHVSQFQEKARRRSAD